MNKILCYLGVILLLILSILSCGEEGKEAVTPEINFPGQSGYASTTSDGNVLVAFPASGGSATVTFSATAEWSTESSGSVSWCTYSPSSGNSGTNRVGISSEKNTSFEGRRTSFTIKSGTVRKTVTITQEAAEQVKETLEVSKDSFTFDFSGGEQTVDITSNAEWSVSGANDWCTVSPKNGKGNGKLTLKVTEQSETSSRKTTLTVKTAGGVSRDIEINQSGAEVFELNPSEVNLKYVSSEFEVKVTATMGYSISSKPDWIKEVSKTSDKNTHTHLFKAEENGEESERTGTIVFCNDKQVCVPVAVSQEGKTVDPVLDVSTVELSFDCEGAEQKFSVSSNVEWTASSSQSWCTISPKSGNGNGTVTVTVAENTQTSTRSATITVKTSSGLEKTVKVTQTGVVVFSVDPTDVSLSYGEESFDITVTSSVGFSISSTPDWIKHTGTGANGTVYTFKAEANTAKTERTGVIVFCNEKETCLPVNVKQAGKPEEPTLDISVTSVDFDMDGGEKSVTLTSNQSWTASSDKTWCQVTPSSGTGNGSLTIKAQKNSETSARSATITVKTSTGISKSIVVTQRGEDVFTVSPTEVKLQSSSSSFKIAVTSTLGFEISSLPDWIKHSATSADGKVFTFTADENTTIEERTGTIVFCNDKQVCVPVTVKQAGLTPSLEVTPMSVYFGESAESRNASISTNMGWTVSSSESWCTVSPASGNGNGEITISVLKNENTTSRTASLTVKSSNGEITRTIAVSQDGNESSTFAWDKEFYHKSLLMKFTATWCGYCPLMAQTAHLYQSKYPGTLEVVNVHGSGSNLYAQAFDPLIEYYNSSASYPTGVVDLRNSLANYNPEYGVDVLKQFVDEQESNYPVVSTMGYASSFSGNTLDINLKLYLKKADSYKVNVIITESGIVDYQADNYDGNSNNYVHNDVARIAVTDVMGEEFSTAQDNSIVKKTYSVNIPTSYNKDKLKILVFVQRKFGTQQVLQSGISGEYYIDNCAIGKAGGQLSPAVGNDAGAGNEDLGSGNPINW